MRRKSASVVRFAVAFAAIVLVAYPLLVPSDGGGGAPVREVGASPSGESAASRPPAIDGAKRDDASTGDPAPPARPETPSAVVAAESRERVAARYTIRLLREDRTPIVNTPVALEFHETSGTSTMSTGTQHVTDAEGRLAFDRNVLPEGPALRADLELPPGAVQRRVQHLLERPPVEGANDLGDLVVPLLPLIASGRVIDAHGAGVAGATVRLYGPRFGLGGVSPGYDATGDETSTRDDGSFELRGDRSGDLAIGASKKGVGDGGKSPFATGVTGLEIVLAAPGAIEGNVKPVPGIPLEIVTAGLFDGDGDPQRSFGMSYPFAVADVGVDGRFRFDDLPTGEYTVRLEATHPDPLVEVKGVVVRSGETTRDPRLTDLVLDATVGVIDIRIVDASGSPFVASAPAKEPTVMVRARSREHSVGANRVGTGVFRALAQPAGQDVVVFAADHVPQWIPDVKASPAPLVVTLAAAPIVRVELAGSFELEKGPRRLGVRLTPALATLETIPAPLAGRLDIEATFDPVRRAALAVPFPGAYDVAFFLREQVGSFARDRSLDGSHVIAVTSGPDQKLTIEAPEAVRAALAR